MSEKDVIEQHEEGEKVYSDDRLDISTLKYFYQASPLAGRKKDSIPKFLRSLRVLENFTDYELRVFASFIHERKYKNEEVVFREGESGYGFYLIYSGNLEIYTQKSRVKEGVAETYQQFVANLGKAEYLGELALLEQQNKRNATAISKGNTTLLAIYKPDIEEMIDRHPVIGAKFLQAISLIVAMRFISVTEELRHLKEKCQNLEIKLDESTD
ncbi:MAG: hypothetical protein CME62_16660 [Halobacteriovoraceae bacterium]|nr:hypothetical protein [Halobacteriovoraceae bacterium]|tara:strand:- start:17409 stop:18047 length:639 start_codon:yes stop_codon:yes gene_type:complete